MEILDKNTLSHIIEASGAAYSYKQYKQQFFMLAKLAFGAWAFILLAVGVAVYYNWLDYFALFVIFMGGAAAIWQKRKMILDLKEDTFYVAKDIFLGIKHTRKRRDSSSNRDVWVDHYFALFEEEGQKELPEKDASIGRLDAESRAFAEQMLRHANLQDVFDLPEKSEVFVVLAPYSKVLLDVIPVENVKLI